MSALKPTKINKLLQKHPRGTVLMSSWLTEQGYSLDLQKRYRKSGWLKSIGTGAMVRTGQDISYEGGVYALQRQLGLSVHLGGRTALVKHGRTHYMEFQEMKFDLFGAPGVSLPAWFLNYDWGRRVRYYRTAFLSSEIDLHEHDMGEYKILISGKTRAIMECLYLVPIKQDFMVCYNMLEGLPDLQPDKVQKLLEDCNSIKVKRLFLYMAEKAGHEWFKYLDMDKFDLGSGKRSIVTNGVFVPKYGITVPREMEANAQPGI